MARRRAGGGTESRLIGTTHWVLTRSNPRNPVIGLLAAIALAGCGGEERTSGEAAAERTATPALPTRATPSKVSDGSTTLALSASVTTLLDLAGVEIVPVGPAARTGDEIELPVSTGTVGVRPLAGRLAHEGGIRFDGGGGSVEATDLRLDLRAGRATAEVEGERIALLETRFEPARLSADRQSVVLRGRDVKVTDEALAPLNAAIGSDVVPPGLTIGDLTVDARWP